MADLHSCIDRYLGQCLNDPLGLLATERGDPALHFLKHLVLDSRLADVEVGMVEGLQYLAVGVSITTGRNRRKQHLPGR